MSNKSQMIPKISPQHYILSSTTIHCRSLPLSKEKTDFSSRALIKIYFELQGAGEDRETNFFCSKSTSSPGTIYSSQYFYFIFLSILQCSVRSTKMKKVNFLSIVFFWGEVGGLVVCFSECVFISIFF